MKSSATTEKSIERSGKFVVRVGAELHERLKRIAEKSGISLNQVCVDLLSQSVSVASLDFLRDLDFSPIGILQYGSAARGERTEGSDVDWLLVVPKAIPVDRGLYERIDLLTLPDKRISMNASHLPENLRDLSNFWLEVALEAEIILDPSGELRKRILEIRRAIAAGRFLRHLTHGQPYWIQGKLNAKSKVG